MNPSPVRKIFQGVADRRQMFRLFDRHNQRPNRWNDKSGSLHAGEWFEIDEVQHDEMLEILPPLWMKPDMFAMREFLAGSTTSVFFRLPIDGQTRHFHGYCDLSDKSAAADMRRVILDRETRPVRAMTRVERLEHIWSETHDSYRGYADADWPKRSQGYRIVMSYDGLKGSMKVLEHLSDAEIAAKLPVHLRYLPDMAA